MAATRAKVAVVDDDESVRKGLRRVLQSVRCVVVAFESAEEFLAAGGIDEIDCLIADLHLPGMSGAALVHHLADAGTPLPAIIITAHDDPASRELIQQMAPVPWLLKPFTGVALCEAMQRLLPDVDC